MQPHDCAGASQGHLRHKWMHLRRLGTHSGLHFLHGQAEGLSSKQDERGPQGWPLGACALKGVGAVVALAMLIIGPRSMHMQTSLTT